MRTRDLRNWSDPEIMAVKGPDVSKTKSDANVNSGCSIVIAWSKDLKS